MYHHTAGDISSSAYLCHMQMPVFYISPYDLKIFSMNDTWPKIPPSHALIWCLILWILFSFQISYSTAASSIDIMRFVFQQFHAICQYWRTITFHILPACRANDLLSIYPLTFYVICLLANSPEEHSHGSEQALRFLDIFIWVVMLGFLNAALISSLSLLLTASPQHRQARENL